jgi:LuxR family maltose regulon positive regulatory protein
MVTQLLATKLFIPRLRPELVPRQRLIDRLNHGLRSGHRLTLISAPAGFGKTTLVAEWLRQAKQPSAWLSLDKNDNDPVRFLTYLLTALQKVDPDIGKTTLGMLRTPNPPPLAPLLTALINDIAATPRPFIFVLDDYHTIGAHSIHDGLTFLLDHLPPPSEGMHLVIGTRADPPLPVPRLRGRGQLSEIYQSDLRFTRKEMAQFLELVLGLRLSAEDMVALERRTEGWIAGLQMAALSMQGRDDIAGFLRAFAGSHRYILDYLSEEVLCQESKDVQTFLLQTSILDRLSGALCDTVMGATESADVDSQSVLEYLEKNNLFVGPLDDERKWYRYHHLLTDLLRQRLQREKPDLVPELHRRASGWYEQSRLTAEAVNHALAAGDYEQAACLVESNAWETLMRGECTTLLDWIDAFPDRLVRSRPRLGVSRAWSLTLTGQLDSAEAYLSDIDVQHVQGEVAAIRAHIAGLQDDGPRSIEFARQAFAHLPQENVFMRGYFALNLGLAYWRSGDMVSGSEVLSEAASFARAADSKYLTLVATTRLGHVQEMQGLLHQAVATHRDALQLADERGGRPAPYAGVAHVGIAETLYEWNDLDGAMRHAMEGINLCEIGGITSYMLAGRFILAQVAQARGDLDGALEILQKAERLAQRYDYVYLLAEQAELRARLWIAQGNVQAASRWVEGHKVSSIDELDPTIAREIEQIAVARVLIARGLLPDASSNPRHDRSSSHRSPAERVKTAPSRKDEIDEALRLLAKLLEKAQAAERKGSAIKVLALRALVFRALDDQDQALSTLERALSLAEPEGYVRTFVDEGEPMARLLRQALSRDIAPNYVARLLAASGEKAELTSPAMESLIEPLSERELEVLRLVAAGLSNREIAQELVIAVSTVKSHINHIYGKLGVKHRTQAVARAQAIGML